MFSTMVNLANVNGRGTMGKRGSDDTNANCFPPPTEKEIKKNLEKIPKKIPKIF